MIFMIILSAIRKKWVARKILKLKPNQIFILFPKLLDADFLNNSIYAAGSWYRNCHTSSLHSKS